MFGQVSDQVEVNVPASDAWELFSGLGLEKLVGTEPELSRIIAKVDVLVGDGGVGTVLKIIYPPEALFPFHKEKFSKIDNEKRVKEATVIEGGFLDFGFTSYLIRFEIKEKGADSCIIVTTMEYDVKKEAAANASLITIKPLTKIVGIAANHLIKNKT